MHLRIFTVLYLKAIHFSRFLVLMVHCCYHKITQDAENKVYKLIWDNIDQKKDQPLLLSLKRAASSSYIGKALPATQREEILRERRGRQP
jgi:hypothetical protein